MSDFAIIPRVLYNRVLANFPAEQIFQVSAENTKLSTIFCKKKYQVITEYQVITGKLQFSLGMF